MAFKIANRVRETTTTTGTGTVTLAGAVAGFQSFAAIGNGNTCRYLLLDANGTGWEIGTGTYTSAGTTLARTSIEASSNSGSAITLSTGTHTVTVLESAADSQIDSWARRGFIEFQDQRFFQYVDDNSVRLKAGKAVVNGTLLEWSGNVDLNMTSGVAPLAAAGIAYAYLYSNSGTATLEGSTTAPEYNEAAGYWRKTSDSTRRCVGWFYVWATTTPTYRVVPFTTNLISDRCAETVLSADYVDASNSFSVVSPRVLSLTTQSAGVIVSSVQTNTYIPAHALAWLCMPSYADTVAAGKVAIAIGPRAWSASFTSARAGGPYSMRSETSAANVNVFFPPLWIAIESARDFYYGFDLLAGTSANIALDSRGARYPL